MIASDGCGNRGGPGSKCNGAAGNREGVGGNGKGVGGNGEGAVSNGEGAVSNGEVEDEKNRKSAFVKYDFRFFSSSSRIAI